MTRELSNALAKKFIARTDVKAIQHTDGTWAPIRDSWARTDLEDHLAGTRTFGHYLLNSDDKCKLFAFDIDLQPHGVLPSAVDETGMVLDTFAVDDLRAAWHARRHIARPFMKQQFRLMGNMLAKATQDLLGIETAVAYSGNKGIHVYGFTGLIDAASAREAALIVLDHLEFTPTRGDNFFQHPNADPLDGFPNLLVELFPKQDSLEGKDLGNLMRLPLGRNQKHSDPTFFVDMSKAIADLTPVNPLRVLSPGYNMWATEAEASVQ